MIEPDESISSAEEAARRARRGYDYQDLIAAAFCIDMLHDATVIRVECETRDDVVVSRATDFGESADEFIQVKSERLTQQWTVALFCEQESVESSKKSKKGIPKHRAGTSIFEKNALRDKSRRNSKFRIATRADVKDFRVLTGDPASRDAKEIDELAKSLREKLGANTTLSPEDIDYWVRNSTWDVRGTEESIFNAKFRELQQYIENSERRLLPFFELERLFHQLVQEARAMASRGGKIGGNRNAVTRRELGDWLSTRVRAIPRFLGATEEEKLRHEERASFTRCEGLWIALGVSQAEAESLARQPDIGARTDFFAQLSTGFHWIVASYGAGKSLASEREFQRQIADYSAQRDSRVPIFIRAASVSGGLQDVVHARLNHLNPDKSGSPLFVIVDAVDEAGADHAQRLLQECYEISRTWSDSTIIATSTPLPFGFDAFKKEFPKLPPEKAAEIVAQFAGHAVAHWSANDRLGSDAGLALPCVLLGLALRETANSNPSKAELLDRVVKAALRRSGNDTSRWGEETDLLCKIAAFSTDSGGGPIVADTIGLLNTQLLPLYKTRLIAEVDGKLIFTVTTMRLWFAAGALRKGLVNPDCLAQDPARARHWNAALAIFVATSEFDDAASFLEPLAAANPSAAAKVIADSTTRWGSGVERPPNELEIFSGRIRRCLTSWLAGIEPLGPICSFTDQNGRLLKVCVGHGDSLLGDKDLSWSSEGAYTQIAFSRDPALPDASVLPSN